MRFRSLLLVLTLVPMPTFPLVAQDYYRDSAPQLDLPQVGSGPVSIAPAPPQVDTPMSRPASGGAIPEYGRPAYDPNDPSSAQNPDSSYADRYQSP